MPTPTAPVPAAATLQVVLEVARDLFDQPELDAGSNFIEEGGHSLLAVEFDDRLVARIGRGVVFNVLYRSTFAEVAEAIDTHAVESDGGRAALT